MPEAVPIGRSVEDVVEAETGCLYSIALTLNMLSSELYATGEQFRYDDDNPVAVELTRRVDELTEFIEDLSLTPDGTLTNNRECRRCSGAGRTSGEDPCVECGGRGYVHREEANG
jgi:hypothetical protein